MCECDLMQWISDTAYWTKPEPIVLDTRVARWMQRRLAPYLKLALMVDGCPALVVQVPLYYKWDP
jgi:hypothetical protein